ncbi:MAG TPA: hypothetical protein VFK16_08145 [Gemmatimonadaceae bacterium]|jgi:hypothetical protein|nr:hypothetical protein [Gemmatimonadaceae bacterium]
MKKHRTQVPDFSRKRVARPDAEPTKLAHEHAPSPVSRPTPVVKPRATSSKSGRRGT